MKKLSNIFFSMQSMGILILIFAFSIGAATFIENDFGSTAARAVVYDATWFDILLGLLAANLIANIIRYRMYRRKKFTMFIFHSAFLIILLGAAITRFVSFEGMLHLREGETSNAILSDHTYVQVSAVTDNASVKAKKHVMLSALTPDAYHQNLRVGDKRIELTTVKFIPSARETISEGQTEAPVITLVASTGTRGRTNLYLKSGEKQQIENHVIKFGKVNDPKAVNITLKGDLLFIAAPDSIRTTPMKGGGPSETLAPGKPYQFVKGKLYSENGLNIVLTNFYTHGKIGYVPSKNKNANLMDVLIVKATSGNQSKEVKLKGGKGYHGKENIFTLNGIKLKMKYGSNEIKLPFSIKLKKFELTRYPGSMSPSSYASRVVVIDKAKNLNMPYRIYMNHVLNYRGYRLFQSSYDLDEHGSILAVNHDFWGTFFTYAGYLLMALGMFLSLLNVNSYFSTLGRYLKKASATSKAILLILFFTTTFSTVGYARPGRFNFSKIPVVNKAQADHFGHLLVQSNDGRIKPVNTLASEILRKLTWKSKQFPRPDS